MNAVPSGPALRTAIAAATAAGELMRRNMRATKKVNEATQHDIKLELDVRCQKRIERILGRAYPSLPILGEEGIVGDPEAGARWVVDPIDGTVNFTYGIPHACVSIALQARVENGSSRPRGGRAGSRPGAADGAQFESVLGVVYDPFCQELWTGTRGGPARMNGRVVRVSRRRRLAESIVSLGFAKDPLTLKQMLPTLNTLIHRVRKIRIMGAAALSLVYVASGRMDAYVEYGLRLWDIAAGGLIVECAGGRFRSRLVRSPYFYEILAANSLLAPSLEEIAP